MSPAISNIVIIGVLAIILFLAVKNAIPHFKGEGSCCGGGGSLKLIKPKKLERVIGVKKIMIEGMTCDHCSGRIQNALNSIDGINAKVIRSRNLAIVKLGKELDEELIKKTITELGYQVVRMEEG